ncbi:sla2 Src-like adaptor 2 [Orbilia oligospora]|uniref:Sla2 Src-like adaptor 2 n=1 Tax=Orbilia oligospora TaxID=2813651 RepID=A0A7C8JQA4_ORBOL|nr:sla2 Src-like adaptor 2 [Orbilia oligospora]KAF3084319.1 sla2 Src-like adaptor 2 [Orbilia oligospora]KAF3099379.1 sla2 Src-like adaptor 2 [Orbilia oligospora]KAF3134578.1 sla2 Src-like adaptor 2 [Orbilia oligospora]KAF3138433.1 sla2 Src-like adaptor 2 [Orbilia oligospora]
MAYTGPSRNVDLSKTESELTVNIRKATSIEETAPKRKHVRSCIVYTWDHKSSQSFWAGMKVQPILADEIQTFKALQCIHKVLQEGAPVTLKEAQQHTQWIESLTRGVSGEGLRGYGPLIREYVYFLLKKLQFHRHHPEFNGTFEYEEYISLKTINDPNEGYETISDLATLQDQIDTFQKLIFAHFRPGTNNECRISALVPLVHESYGIYKFLTSMLRAMHQTLGDDEALEPLRKRYTSQHYRLVKFYYECSNLRYLTSLITVPKLPQDPPNLQSEDDKPPALPARPANETPKPRSPSPPPPPAKSAEPQPINDFWSTQEAQNQLQQQQQRQYEDEQRRLQEQLEAERLRQQQLQYAQQQEFERQQAQQAEAQRLAQEQLLRDQYERQVQGKLAEMERDLLNMRGQYERDQLLLEQYDRKVKALEIELQNVAINAQQAAASKDDLIKSLQEQVALWKSKYDSLAKLYSQLRTEHLDLLQKYKAMQLKASSAQEAIDKREKLEREMKTKNLELADMIRERDRALFDLDRSKGGNKDELEKLQRELRMAIDRADGAEKSKGSEFSVLINKHTREVDDLNRVLRDKQRQLDELSARTKDGDSDLQRLLRDKEDEIDVMQEAMDQLIREMKELQDAAGERDLATGNQIDNVLLDHIGKLNGLIDSVLQSGVKRVDDALYELESPMQAGNQNATAAYLLSQLEKAGLSATEFATSFNNFIADGPNGDHSAIIKTVSVLASAISDVLVNAKGITRLAPDEKKADAIINAARLSANATAKFFNNLMSFRIIDYDDEAKIGIVVAGNHDVHQNLQKLSKLTEAFAPKGGSLANQSGNLEDIVDRELGAAAAAIEAAAARLSKMANRNRDYDTFELEIHDSILNSAVAITTAITALIKAATDSQREIVAQGKGGGSRTAFYKRNNRWTEGLISAAKAVATSTNLLIETADGVIVGRNKLEQLIVACNDVTASTAQLVAASRVKATFMSKTQDRLEGASKAVNSACRSLVKQVQDIIKAKASAENDVDYTKLTSHEFKVQEMEKQVEILELTNALERARKDLGEMRKHSYREE